MGLLESASCAIPHAPGGLTLPPTAPLTPPPLPLRRARLSKFDAEGVLADYPLPFDAMEEPELPAAGGRGGAKTPARGGRRAAAADDSSEEEDTGPQMPSDDDDDEEDGQVGGCTCGPAALRPWPVVVRCVQSLSGTLLPQPAHTLLPLPHPPPQERTPARVPPTASRRMPDRAARSARKPVVDATTSSSDEEAEESDGEEAAQDSEGEEGDDGLSPLAENVSPAVRRPSKARRQSSDSVSALRQALQENRIS